MRTKILSFIKKYGLPLWCILSALSVCCLFVAAEYTVTTSSMKKVVASTSEQGRMFSSNVLSENGSSSYVAKYFETHLANEETHTIAPYDVDVYFWNYSLNNLSKWYSSDIDYKITVTMTDSNGESSKVTATDMGDRTVQLIKVTRVVKVDPDSHTETITYPETILATLKGGETSPRLTYTTNVQTLVHNSANSAEEHYIMRFSSNWDLENDTEICVKTIAEPYKGSEESKYKDLSSLGAIIGLRETTGSESPVWQAYLAEESSGMTVDNCDGYNLVVTGSGAAKITIKWNTDKLACNKNFYNNTIYSFGTYTITVDGNPQSVREVSDVSYSGNTATMTIMADSGRDETNNRNRYDIQFYKTGAEPSDWSFFKDDGSTISNNTWLSVEIVQ